MEAAGIVDAIGPTRMPLMLITLPFSGVKVDWQNLDVFALIAITLPDSMPFSMPRQLQIAYGTSHVAWIIVRVCRRVKHLVLVPPAVWD